MCVMSVCVCVCVCTSSCRDHRTETQRLFLQHALAAATDSTNGVRLIQFITCPIIVRVELNTHNDTHSNVKSH